ncbi:Armadillo-like helical [Penicillium griseofulvum]|uniref:Armadillo-like helical n=1 Tax=Penicillium patulum TaxID=5078 RepID=A0A135LUI2_PENPA|nr:Armadillo-like helical [Penicillium griseofulvum]KXG52633.1 Armadillo-like helical [Penicillium griseofulvum]
MGNGGRYTSNDGIDVRNISFGHESSQSPQNSIAHYGSSDVAETSRHGKLQVSSGEGAEHSSGKKQKLDHIKVEPLNGQRSDLDRILAKISPRTIPLQRSETDRSSASSQTTPATTVPALTLTETTQPYPQEDRTVELLRLKQELLAANSKIALQEQELAQTRVIKHTLDQTIGPSSEVDFGNREITEQTISHLQNAFNASSSAFSQFQEVWGAQDDSQSDVSDPLSTGAYNRSRGLWVQNNPATDREYGESLSGTSSSTSQDPNRFWGLSNVYPPFAGPPSLQSQRAHSGTSASPCGFYSRPIGEQMLYPPGPITGARRSNTQSSRGGSLFPIQSTPWGEFASGSSSEQTPKPPASPKRPPSAFQQVGLYSVPSYSHRPIGSPLSPTAAEFTGISTNEATWTNSMSGNSIQTYVSPLEPLNYRRLLDKNVSCDWKYIVDKIICNNDQQASIFLQQKLKVGTTEQKYDIIESIVHQAYPLMVNRFGNFLIQRCFEHGTPEQVVAIANAIRGNTLNLSMDAFGCHVVQKAFDCVSEEHKAIMVHELLRRIPETVVHRYACHVWQKLFELRWSGEPPQVMAKVNEALRGMWHEVALGETGSLVVQNIFENCVEDEKRPAIEEVLAKIDVLAHGQFGNWCIQHICEHGAPHDKSRAVEHVLRWAVDYSMDQFASKIVEKCLKIGGTEFMDRYLSRVCTGRSDRPRMPLIDIAGDQYGNYLIQWILMNAAPHQRELVASHIRKHMVSLRGSKFGSRVAMLCCNPSHATRPGPGAGMQIGRFNNFNEDKFTTNQSGGRFARGHQWGPNYAPLR